MLKLSFKISLLLSIMLISVSAFAQFGYKHKLDPNSGLEIKYKYAHEKIFNKNSPLNLRIKIKNTNNYDVNLSFIVIYEKGIATQFESELISIDIKSGRARTGKWHGLNFETGYNSEEKLKSDEFTWHFDTFEVKICE